MYQFDWYYFLGTMAIYAVMALVSLNRGTFLAVQRREPILLTFAGNWPISIGIPLFAVMNGLMFSNPGSILANHYPETLVIAGSLGAFVTYLFYDNWCRHPGKNWGAIIDRTGYPTGAGYIHAPYMSLQTSAILLFIITPTDVLTLGIVTALFLIFVGLVNALAAFVQKNFNSTILGWEIFGVVGIVAAKVWWQ